mmetsp:Transcript_8569/g.15661  ORF Transcript_8569/g.15661 Transcript_8569/m.15661 type:complete len:230 (+) Transcript_8569:189-878(+)
MIFDQCRSVVCLPFLVLDVSKTTSPPRTAKSFPSLLSWPFPSVVATGRINGSISIISMRTVGIVRNYHRYIGKVSFIRKEFPGIQYVLFISGSKIVDDGWQIRLVGKYVQSMRKEGQSTIQCLLEKGQELWFGIQNSIRFRQVHILPIVGIVVLGTKPESSFGTVNIHGTVQSILHPYQCCSRNVVFGKVGSNPVAICHSYVADFHIGDTNGYRPRLCYCRRCNTIIIF